MIQIIKRIEEQKTQKETLQGNRFQVSFNDDHRIVLRILTGSYLDSGMDCLVVLDPGCSTQLIRFIQNDLKNLNLKEHTEREINKIDFSDLPF